jgi:hypothetical protein
MKHAWNDATQYSIQIENQTIPQTCEMASMRSLGSSACCLVESLAIPKLFNFTESKYCTKRPTIEFPFIQWSLKGKIPNL